MPLYHRDIGFPRDVEFPTGRQPLKFGKHAWQRMQERMLKPFAVLHNQIDFRSAELIEAEVANDGTLTQALYRLPLAPGSPLDICLVIITGKAYAFVKTVWANARTDNHYSLRRNRYTAP